MTVFGLDPSGQSDNTATLQAAIQQTGGAGGGVLDLPAGVIAYDSRLDLRTAVRLRGQGRTVTKLLYRGTGVGMALRGCSYGGVDSMAFHLEDTQGTYLVLTDECPKAPLDDRGLRNHKVINGVLS